MKNSASASVTITHVKLRRYSATASSKDVFFLYKQEFSDAQEELKIKIIIIKKKKGGLGGKSCITRCPTFLHMGVKATEAPWVWWGGSDPRDGVPSAGVRRQSASPPSPSLSPSAQLTVGTWFKLYSLALSRRLAMLLAMFIPWDVLVLEQVGG